MLQSKILYRIIIFMKLKKNIYMYIFLLKINIPFFLILFIGKEVILRVNNR